MNTQDVQSAKRVTGVDVLPGFQLRLAFPDNEYRVYDASHLVGRAGTLWETLANPDVFAQATLDHGSVSWPGGADLGWFTLYHESEPASAPPMNEHFAALTKRYGNLAELARRGGISRRALDYKRKDPAKVRQWDVWAAERALQLQAEEEGRLTRRDILKAIEALERLL
ncbi:MAG: hypothetical protein AAF752_06590 [Bacteroidota bacterium]